VQFDVSTRKTVRDQAGYDALLKGIAFVEAAEDAVLISLLHDLARRFCHLRESAEIPLARPHRLSLQQTDALVARLLSTPSGGRMPVLLVVALLKSLADRLGMDWIIEWQEINVADSAAGTVGARHCSA